MIDQLPFLVFLVPFVAAVAMPILGHRRPRICRPVTLAAATLMTVLSVVSLYSVCTGSTVRLALGGWSASIGIEWVADPLAAMMAAAVSGLGLICLLYAGGIDDKALEGRTVPYHALLMLLLTGLIGLCYAGDLFNIFVFLEVVALAGYTLAAVPGGRSLMPAFRYLVLGTLGASFYLLGVAYVYASTGLLNLAALAELGPGALESTAVLSGMAFIFGGLAIKMALVPLHGWLPDAYESAAESAVPLMAGLLTKLAILAWGRILLAILPDFSEMTGNDVRAAVAVIGMLAAIAGGMLALRQTVLKRIFAFGGIAHVGVVMIGLGQVSSRGVAGGLYYLLNDAVLQCTLFLLCGILASRYGIRTLDDLARVNVRSPWALGAFVIAALGMIGIPPTGGFFGKAYIVLGSLEAGHYWAAGAVILASLITVAYFARLLAVLFRSGTEQAEAADAWPAALRFSVAVPALAVLALGLWNDPIFANLFDQLAGVGL